MSQPSEIQRNLDAEIVANLTDGLTCEHLFHPVLPEALQSFLLVDGKYLEDDFGTETS